MHECKILRIELKGRIDSDNAQALGREIADRRGRTPHEALVFYAKELTYISSAGLRVLLQVMKEEKLQKHEPVSIIEVSRDVYDILEVTGLTELMDVNKACREISVEGCPVIGQGFFGTVYQLDPDTIVKIYRGEESLPRIRREREMAKMAFLKGLPTAISYDIVRAGTDYGTVFEMLQARSFNDEARDLEGNPKALDELMEQYVACLKQVHGTELEAGDLPRAKDIFLAYLDELAEDLPAEVLQGVRRLLETLPPDSHAVHGDIHMKNVLLCEGEPMLIDMETLSVGQPIFDLQSFYVTYVEFGDDDPDNPRQFLGLGRETCLYLWQKLLSLYFRGRRPEELRLIEEKIRLLAAVRFMQLITKTDLRNNDYAPIRIRHTREQLEKLLSKVGSLEL